MEAGGGVPDDDALAVRAGRRPTVGVVLLGRFDVRMGDGLGPEDGARLPVEAEQAALLPLLLGARDEDAALGDDRAAVAGARQRGFPAEVLLRPPFERELRFRARARPERPAVLG